MRQAKVIVVGAGLAGLSAAYRLQQAGFTVQVLEKMDRIGGRVLTLRRDGYVIDAGPDAMTDGYVNYKTLVRDLGLGKALTASSTVAGFIRDGRVVDVDTQNVWAMVLAPILSWPAKLRFAWSIFRNRKLFAGVNSFRLTDSAAFDTEAESARDLSLRLFGREFTEYVMDPVIRLTVGTSCGHASRLNVLGGLVNWSAALINMTGGLDVLPNALARRVPIRTGVDVEHVGETGDGVEVRWSDADGASHVEQADFCVVATTYDVTEKIYPGIAAYAGHYSEKLEFLPLVSISLAYSAATRSEAYAVQVPTVESADALLIFLQHNKAPDRAPPGCSLITVYTDGLASERYLAKSDAEIVAWARSEIEPRFPELAGKLSFATVSRWPRAGYFATPGFWKRTKALLDALPRQGRIQVGGDLFGAGSMESAITWGEQAARNLIEHHAARRP